MRLWNVLLAAAAAAVLAACTPAPAKSIEKDCVRLEMLSELGGADSKKNCACFAGKLKDSMSEKNLKSLAKALRTAKNSDEVEANAKANNLDDSVAMSMMTAAKSCATAS